MSDLSSIRIPGFSGKKDEWLIWRLKFLAKAKFSGLKYLLLG
jgi:hypothetical protein